MLLAYEYSMFDALIYSDSAKEIFNWFAFDFLVSGTSRLAVGDDAGEGEGEGDWHCPTRFGLLLLENSFSAWELLEKLLP